MKLAIVIFRNNLRIEDNPSLFYATKSNDRVLGLYSFEILEGNLYGFKKCEKYREAFVKDSLLTLKDSLHQYGINLCFTNDFSSTLAKLSQKFDISIYFDEEVGFEEQNLQKVFTRYKHKSYFNQTMIEPFKFDFTKSFSHFRNKAEKLEIPKPLGLPNRVKTVEFESVQFSKPMITYPENAIFFKAGEHRAKQRLEDYMNNIHSYKETRNAMSGFDNSTKFSPYLSVGNISARMIYHGLKEEERRGYQSQSSYWIYFELLWRDFFHLVMLYSQNRLFLKSGIKGIDFTFRTDRKSLDEFFTANTGIDIIDASIMELKSSGWLSNRNRQLVASYFVKNLGLDWRVCAAFFESYLVDYNPASNYGNFAYQAYVGNDKRYRVFDPLKQASMYDGDKYINIWLHRKQNMKNINYEKLAQKVKEEVFHIK